MIEQVGRLSVSGRYEVVVGRGIVEQLPTLLGEVPARVAVCVPATLPQLAQPIHNLLRDAGAQVLRLDLPEGEAAKTAEVAISAWEALGAAGFTRSDVMVTVGGGATTDMGGFLAATWLRGVRVIHVPTTLLAMVDAAVGGKTAMNTSAGKNMVGSFHEPAGVICDLHYLETLPPTDMISGMAEILKCGFIADPTILETTELQELVVRAITVKVDVVADDLRETGGGEGHPGREALNYGHTFGHALEKVTNYRMRHGDAVALGMVFIAEVARRGGYIDDALAARHTSVLAAAGLPTTFAHPRVADLALAAYQFEDLIAAMRVDKKARGTQMRLVVLDGIARPITVIDPPLEHLAAAYAVVSA